MQDLGSFMTVSDGITLRGQKTRFWRIYNKRSCSMLGSVEWMSDWRQYVFRPCIGTVYSSGCLDDIAAFVREQNVAQKTATKGQDDD